MPDAAERTLHGGPARFEPGFRRVGEDTWAWLQPNGGLGESNAGLLVSGEHALLVDTLWDLALTRRMLDAADDLIDAPPETLVNTHSDGDHVWGNQLLGGARIVSTVTAKELMTLDTPRDLRRLKRLGRVLRPLGREMAPFDWSGVELTLPNETFEGELTLAVGAREVQLIEVGPAHTAGDAVVWVPDVSACFAADILFIGCTPITWAGAPAPADCPRAAREPRPERGDLRDARPALHSGRDPRGSDAGRQLRDARGRSQHLRRTAGGCVERE